MTDESSSTMHPFAASTFSPEWEALFDAMEDGVCIQSLDSRILRANQAFAEMIGLPIGQIIGKACAEVFGCSGETGIPPHFCARKAGLDQNRIVEEEVIGRHPRQKLRSRVSPVRDKEGVITAFVMIVSDVTDVVAYQRERARVEQLARLGELAAGLAHEIKNPLAGIQGVVDILIQRRSQADPEREALEGVRREVARIDAIIQLLLNRARPRNFTFKLSSLVESVNHAVRVARATLASESGKRININFTPPNSPLLMMIDAAQMEDAVLNLILNAIESIDGDGSINVTLSETAAADEAGGEAVIDVVDTGRGIPPEQIQHIFSPFFTTSEKGAGLGLPAVRRVVRAHHGRVEVASTPGSGSTFIIRLPRVVEVQ